MNAEHPHGRLMDARSVVPHSHIGECIRTINIFLASEVFGGNSTKTVHLHKKDIHSLSDLNRSLVEYIIGFECFRAEWRNARTRTFSWIMDRSIQRKEARFPIINLWYEFLSSMTHDSHPPRRRRRSRILSRKEGNLTKKMASRIPATAPVALRCDKAFLQAFAIRLIWHVISARKQPIFLSLSPERDPFGVHRITCRVATLYQSQAIPPTNNFPAKFDQQKQ